MRDILTSPRIEDMKRKRRARRMRLSILIFMLLASLVGALAYFSGNFHVTLNKVAVTGTRIINSPDIEATVREEISGKYLRLFSRADTLIYPKKRIYRDLFVKFLRIEKLSIYRDNWNTLHIDIKERAGSFLYCGSALPQSPSDVGENCYFINNDGYIFDKAPYFSGNIYFKYYMPLAVDDGTVLGQQMLAPEAFHKLARFIDGIEALSFKPIYLVVEPDGMNSLYLNHSQSNTSPKIVYKNDNDLNTILDNLSISMKQKEFANEINQKYATLLYIDLRFDNKVLYKFNQ
jgi:hypothetical protein